MAFLIYQRHDVCMNVTKLERCDRFYEQYNRDAN